MSDEVKGEPTGIQNYPDLFYQVKYWAKSEATRLEFEVYHILSMDTNGEDIQIEECFEVEGWVNFDGCMNWRTNETTYNHFCNMNMVKNFYELLIIIYKEAESIGCDIT